MKDLAWQVFVAPAERGLLFGLKSDGRTDEALSDAFVARTRWLLPENEYGLQIVRAYVAPRLDAASLRTHFTNAIAKRLPRRAERLLLIVEGFDLLESADRIAHLETLRLALRVPSVVILVTSAGFDPREIKFFDRIDPASPTHASQLSAAG